MIKTSTLAVILGVLVLSVTVFANDADATGLVWRAINKAGSHLYDMADVSATCSNRQFLQWQSSNSTFICKDFRLDTKSASNDVFITGINNSTGVVTTNQFSVNLKTCASTDKVSSIDNVTGNVICTADTTGLASINADTTSAQTIVGVSTNTTATTASGVTTIKLGNNVIFATSGQSTAQNVTKGLTIQGLSTKIFNATTNVTLNAYNDTILVHPPSAGRAKYTITLPSASNVPGKILHFIYTSQMGVPVKIATSPATQLINQRNNFNMTEYREQVSIQSTGIGWIMLNSGVHFGTDDGPLLIEDDFPTSNVTTLQIGTNGWTLAGATLAAIRTESGHPGLLSHSAANAAKLTLSLGTQTFQTGSVMPDQGYYDLEFVMKPTTIANTAEVRAGLAQSPVFPNGTAIQNAMIIYNGSRSTNWMCNTRDTSGFTSVVSNKVVNNQWYDLRIVHVNKTGTDFWVNDDLICTINTNAPTTSIQPFYSVAGRGATTTATLDYFRFWQPNATSGR